MDRHLTPSHTCASLPYSPPRLRRVPYSGYAACPLPFCVAGAQGGTLALTGARAEGKRPAGSAVRGRRVEGSASDGRERGSVGWGLFSSWPARKGRHCHLEAQFRAKM